MKAIKKMLSLSDLDRLDNGDFGRMVEGIRKFARDESEVHELVCVTLIQRTARQARKEKQGLPTFPLHFFDNIPKKKRGYLGSTNRTRHGLSQFYQSVHMYSERPPSGREIEHETTTSQAVGGAGTLTAYLLKNEPKQINDVVVEEKTVKVISKKRHRSMVEGKGNELQKNKHMIKELKNQDQKVGVSRNKQCRFTKAEEASKELKKSMKKKKKNKYKINLAELGLDSPPELPADLREVVERKGGENLKLVIIKPMTATDLNTTNNRFQFSKAQIVTSDFLTQEEKGLTKTRDGLNVTVLIEPSLDEHNLSLREWYMTTSIHYALVSGWNSAIKDEKESGILKECDIVQLWSFRRDGNLWFLLHKMRNQNRVEAETCSNGERDSSPISVISNHEQED